jgi:DNA-binding MarR family transcriptional regulator
MPTRTSIGEALEELMVEVTYAFFPLRALGSQLGANAAWGGSYWGMLRSLKLEGPQTVAQIARSRPVPRQSIQKLANEMIQAGLIELVENPAHKRAKLLHLTEKGELTLLELSERITVEIEIFAQELDASELADLQVAAKVVRNLQCKLKQFLQLRST